MAKSSSSLMVLAIVATLLGVAYGLATVCQGDMQGLITRCAVYVQKGTPVADPSPTCCSAVKTVDIPCVCQKITKEVETVVDMDKVFRLASYCGRPLAHGTKCGSK